MKEPNLFISNPLRQIQFQAYNDKLPNVQNCICAEFKLQNCTWTSETISSSNFLITWTITHPTTGYGFCTLKEGGNVPPTITTLAIVG